MLDIRFASNLDRDDINGVYMQAFPESENKAVADLAIALIAESSKTINLVAESNGIVVGHVAFSPLKADTKENWKGYILAPLAVKPEYQKQGIGTQLIETGIEQLEEKAVDMLFAYGDPKYYQRFGFWRETAQQFIPPYKLTHPSGWQVMLLNQRDVGESKVKLSCVAPLYNPALW